MKLARLNTLMLLAIIGINSYIIGAPFIPVVSFWWHNRGGSAQRQLVQKITTPQSTGGKTTAPAVNEPNQVIIPSMLLDQPILEDSVKNTYKVLAKGIWRWPNGSTPDKGSNTVLIGHRFTYTQPKGALYYLNKVKLGDSIGLVWNNVHYTYRVSSISTVSPSAVDVEAPSKDPQLTIFTCTPLWNPTQRLVVVATLESTS